MKPRQNRNFLLFFVCLGVSLFSFANPDALAAKEQLLNGKTAAQVIQDVQTRLEGSSSVADMKMRIVRPRWKRTLHMKSWSQGTKLSFVRILSPQRERGIASLKRGEQMWNYLPRAAMVVKIPSSMMGSSWMGSDFSNDDLIKASSITRDYKAHFLAADKKAPASTSIQLTPKPNAPVVWGKIIIVVRTKDLLPQKQEYYSEQGKKVREMLFLQPKMMGGKLFPSIMQMKVMAKPKNLTEIEYVSIAFNAKVSRRIFTLRNLKKKNW